MRLSSSKTALYSRMQMGLQGVAGVAVPWLVPSPGGSCFFPAPPVLQSCAHLSLCYRQVSRCCVTFWMMAFAPLSCENQQRNSRVCACARCSSWVERFPPALCSWQAAQFMVLAVFDLVLYSHEGEHTSAWENMSHNPNKTREKFVVCNRTVSYMSIFTFLKGTPAWLL